MKIYKLRYPLVSSKPVIVFILNFLLCLMISVPVQAQSVSIPPVEDPAFFDNNELDGDIELDEGEFNEDIDDFNTKQDSIGSSSSLLGKARLTLKHLAAYQYGKPEKTVANRSSLRLEWDRFFADRFYFLIDGKIEGFSGNDHVAQAKDETYLVKGSLREGYLQASFDRFAIKIGRQGVVWGEADSAVVTDIISPRDQSEFVFTTLEDSRLGQALIQLEFYGSSWTLQLLVNPEPRLDLLSEEGTEYYIERFDPRFFEVTEEHPNEQDTEFGFRLKKNFEKGDLSCMLGDFVENQPKFQYEGTTPQGKMKLTEGFSRFQMIGLTGNYSSGSFLWQGELAYKRHRAFQNKNPTIDKGLIYKNRLDAALGLEYTPTGRYTVKLEAANQHTYEWEDSIASVYENESTVTLIARTTFLHDTLKLQYTGSNQVENEYFIQQLEIDYEFSDVIKGILTITDLDFKDQDADLWPLRNKDRISASLQWQF